MTTLKISFVPTAQKLSHFVSDASNMAAIQRGKKYQAFEGLQLRLYVLKLLRTSNSFRRRRSELQLACRNLTCE
jgi:hypothetical protein